MEKRLGYGRKRGVNMLEHTIQQNEYKDSEQMGDNKKQMHRKRKHHILAAIVLLAFLFFGIKGLVKMVEDITSHLGRYESADQIAVCMTDYDDIGPE